MNQGKVVQIIGAVVDVEFPRESVPKVYDALTIAGTEITLEVQQQLGDGVVRTIALGSTDGLKRNLIAQNSGKAISVDSQMRTNLEGVFAAGDCDDALHQVTGEKVYIPLGSTANKQGRVAGSNAAGMGCTCEGVAGTAVV